MTASSGEALWADIRSRHPRFREAVAADAAITARFRGERHEFRSRATWPLSRCGCAW